MADTSYKAAFAELIITPSPPNFPQPPVPARIPVSEDVKISGGAATIATRVDTDFDGTPSELLVQTMVIEDSDGARVAIIAVDVLGMSPTFVRDIKHEISSATDIPADHVLLNSSHTHTAAAVQYLAGGFCAIGSAEQFPLPDFVPEVKARILSTVQNAVDSLVDASLHFGRTTTSIAGYRRKDGFQPFGEPRPEDLDILQARDSEGETIGILFSTPCHPACQYGKAMMSADFVSEARKRIEQANGAPAIYIQGFAGDLSPWRLIQAKPDDKAATGEELAADVLTALEGTLVELSGPITAAITSTALPLDSVDPLTWGIKPVRTWPSFGAPTVDLSIQIIRFGSDSASEQSWTLLALSHEAVSEWVPDVKAALPAITNLTLAAYSNGVQCYLPTTRMIVADKTNCGAVPLGYEGCLSFGVYYQALPLWTDEDILGPIGSFAEEQTLRSAMPELPPLLTDDFEAPSIDRSKWNFHVLGETPRCLQPFNPPAVPVTQGGGALRFTPFPGAVAACYSGYTSVDRFDFVGRQASIVVGQVPTGAGAEFLMSVGADGVHLYRFDIQGSATGPQIFANFNDFDGTVNQVHVGAYNAATQRFIRLRHDPTANSVCWETSVDDTTWSTVHEEPVNFDLSAVLIELIAGTSTSNLTPGIAVIGNFVLA